MASQTQSPSTVVEDFGVGGVPWSNETNAAASDDAYATSALGGGQISFWLKASSFGFSIPASATIDGIIVEIERSRTAGNLEDDALKLTKAGVFGGTDKAAVGVLWPLTASQAYASYGGPIDLWGRTWTPADINATNFGVGLSVESVSIAGTAQVDHMRITVHYTEPSSLVMMP